jgi:4-amino-4-deoxy-L-arabinose transferase-like glycosyltransferase
MSISLRGIFLTSVDKKYKHFTLLLIMLVALYHLLIIGAVGPGDNEAYYWTWSKHLDLSYYDHSPMVAYMIALTTAVGGDSVFFLRIGTVLLFCITSLLIYLLAFEISGSRQTAFFSLGLANIIPLFFLAGILTVPDAPLAVFWLLYLFLLYKTIHGVPWWFWYLMGFILGLAVLSKYFAVLLVPSTLLFLLSDKKVRPYLKSPHPYAALVLSGLVASPILLWNIREGWASFTYQLSTRHESGVFFDNLGNLIAGQLGVVTPLLLFCFIAVLVISTKRGFRPGGDIRDKFIVLTSAPTLVFFFIVMCLTNNAEPHWPGLGYLPLLIGAVSLYPEYLVKKRNLHVRFSRGKYSLSGFLRIWIKGASAFKIFVRAALILPFVFIIFMNIQLFYPLYRPAISSIDNPSDLTGWEVGKYDATSDLFGWPEVAEKVREIAGEMTASAQAPFIFSSHYNVASQVSFALKDTKNVLCLSDSTDQFDFWQNTKDLLGRNAIYICTNRYYLPPQDAFLFERIEGPETVVTIRAEHYNARENYIYRCYGFNGIK